MAGKHILILTSDAGFGHRRAAEAVEAALKESYGDRAVTTIINPIHDPAIPDLIRAVETTYDGMVVDDPTFYQIAYSATDAPVVAQLMQNITTTVLNKTLTEVIATYQPDIILTTYPVFTQAAIRAAKSLDRPIPVNVIVTDLIGVHSVWFHEDANMTFVPTGNVYRQALDQGLDKQRVQLTGLPVMPEFARPPEDRASLRERLGWVKDEATALIVGSARTRQTVGLAQLFDRSGLGLQIAVVSGGDEEVYDDLHGIEWKGHVHVYGLVKNMPDLMHASDIVICKAGGLIVTESLACGLPLILYEALPGQEVGNVRYVAENGAGDWSPGAIGALTTTYAWLAGERAELKKRTAAARRIGKPRAAFDVADWIFKQLA